MNRKSDEFKLRQVYMVRKLLACLRLSFESRAHRVARLDGLDVRTTMAGLTWHHGMHDGRGRVGEGREAAMGSTTVLGDTQLSSLQQ